MNKKFKGYLKKFHAQLVKLRFEKSLFSEDRTNRLRYLHYDGGSSKSLIVVFPACWKGGAKYDYVSTLSGFHCHKLFLLDDSATNGRGNYLMGADKKNLVIDLLANYIKENKIENTWFCGTSKGGSSALYFSYFVPNVNVCIGAPQYHVGTYLYNQTQWPNLTSLLGSEPDETKVKELNEHIRSTVLHSKVKPSCVHLVYSNKEHTYGEHIADMIADLKTSGVNLVEYECDFKKHDDVGKYFAPYLKDYVSKEYF